MAVTSLNYKDYNVIKRFRLITAMHRNGPLPQVMVLMTNSNLQVTKYEFKAGKGVVTPGTSCSAAINLKVPVKRVFQWIRVL